MPTTRACTPSASAVPAASADAASSISNGTCASCGRHYGTPDDAHVHSTAPGSIYVAEVSWIGPVNKTAKVLPAEMVLLWPRESTQSSTP